MKRRSWLYPAGVRRGRLRFALASAFATVTIVDKFTADFHAAPSPEARAVVAAIGSELDLGWLEGSGVTLDNGVVVDENLEAAPRVAALGDVARFVQ